MTNVCLFGRKWVKRMSRMGLRRRRDSLAHVLMPKIFVLRWLLSRFINKNSQEKITLKIFFSQIWNLQFYFYHFRRRARKFVLCPGQKVTKNVFGLLKRGFRLKSLRKNVDWWRGQSLFQRADTNSTKASVLHDNSHAVGMTVARPYGFEIDFVRNPISGSAAWFS